MTPYIPHTDEDRREMLARIGASSIDELFREIPPELRVCGEKLKLPPALDEPRLMAHLQELADRNLDATKLTCFLGAGIYDRYVPASLGAVISRGEFLTAYTPYQPEASQGFLQTIYEFQTMVSELYGTDLANASMYDGSTAMAEAAVMAHGVNGRPRIAVAETVHPHYRQVLETYCWAIGLDVDVQGFGVRGSGFRVQGSGFGVRGSGSGVRGSGFGVQGSGFGVITEEHACLIVQSPNFFGLVEDLAAARAEADRTGALLIVVADPVSCALLKPPGHYGADVVVGEGQPMGVAMGFGGPLVGLFACKQEHVRRIPGRIVGRAPEAHGDRTGYVMTLRTREQDIRREKATSNICTNEALMALAATVYMTALGKNGMRSVAETTIRNTRYAVQELCKAGGKIRFDGKGFGEFVLELPKRAAWVRDALIERGILAGLPLGDYFEELENCLLVAVTELRTRAQIDHYARCLGEVLA